MRLFNKKILATLAAAVTAVSVGSVFSTSASAATFLQGDANGDGSLTMIDLTRLNKYITGQGAADEEMLARLDCDADYAITAADSKILQNNLLGMSSNLSTVTRDNLTVPLNDSEKYYKYDFTATDNKLSDYTLDAVPMMTTVQTRDAINDHVEDNVNMNVVQLYSLNESTEDELVTHGSGFIVDDHVIATAAHCVYSTRGSIVESNFNQNFGVAVYDAECENLLDCLTILEVHIPEKYANLSTNGFEYDYALIYVEEDLSEYGIWNLGVATNEFIENGSEITGSGYPTVSGMDDVPLEFHRYLSLGTTVPHEDLIMETTGMHGERKSGGVMYHRDFVNGTQIKTALAIHVAGYNGHSYGCMLTPARINFFLQNTNIGN